MQLVRMNGFAGAIVTLAGGPVKHEERCHGPLRRALISGIRHRLGRLGYRATRDCGKRRSQGLLVTEKTFEAVSYRDAERSQIFGERVRLSRGLDVLSVVL